MKRRDFIKTTGAAAGAAFFLNGAGLSAMGQPWFLNAITENSDRVLVLIRLSGGNDGLNTVIPLGQYGNLYNARPNIIIPENNILPLSDTVGFHPEMGGMKALFDDGKLGIIQSVGYPNQNRSHFKSMQIWYSGIPEQAELDAGLTGWLGRHLDVLHPTFPEGYPNSQYTAPFAISMGDFVSETCQGQAANYSIALNDPFALESLAEWGGSDFSGTIYGEELAFLRSQITSSNVYFEQIEAAAENGNSLVQYPDTPMGRQLKNVALMISGGLKTKIYTVNLSGFDTHAHQIQAWDPLLGTHAELLRTLSDALYAFQQDLSRLGIEERVIGMTFSEFGRQVRSNASWGTDHGTAAPLFLFGSCINPGIQGDNPEIPEEVPPQEGVPMQRDFRDVYGSVLMDWFEVPEPVIRDILYEGFRYLPVANACAGPVGLEQPHSIPEIDVSCFPNPFREETTIRFASGNEWVRVSILNSLGYEIEVLTNKKLREGEHRIRFDGRNLPAGNYYCRLVMEGRQQTKLLVKAK